MKQLLVAAMAVLILMNAVMFVMLANKTKQVSEPPVVPHYTPFDDVKPEQPVEPEKKEFLPTFIEVKKFRSQSENSIYGDVLSHSKDSPFGNGHGRATNVHETAHGIHVYLRNSNRQSGKVNGFYCLDGKAVIIKEPDMRKSRVAEFVPQNLRSYRFDTYITGQRAWDDTPLYIYDEWSAYVLGGSANVDDVKNGRYKGSWTDGVSGCLGFSIYAVATCMAVEKYDPIYWKNNEQFRNFTIFQLKRAHETFMLGREMSQFKWEKQDKLLNELLTSQEAESMREFMREHLESVWLEDVPVTLTDYEDHQRVVLDQADAIEEISTHRHK